MEEIPNNLSVDVQLEIPSLARAMNNYVSNLKINFDRKDTYTTKFTYGWQTPFLMEAGIGKDWTQEETTMWIKHIIEVKQKSMHLVIDTASHHLLELKERAKKEIIVFSDERLIPQSYFGYVHHRIFALFNGIEGVALDAKHLDLNNSAILGSLLEETRSRLEAEYHRLLKEVTAFSQDNPDGIDLLQLPLNEEKLKIAPIFFGMKETIEKHREGKKTTKKQKK